MSNPKPLPDDELEARSVLMRLYHSRVQGESHYPAQFVNGCAPGLEAQGWIERHGAGWRLTEDGVKAWAVMSEPVTGHYGRSAWLNELYWYSGKPIQRIHLTKLAKHMLRALAEAGGEMPTEKLKAMGRSRRQNTETYGLPVLMSGMYVVIDGDVVRLSVVGQQVAKELEGHGG